MKEKYSFNDLILLYYQDISYLIRILNKNNISLEKNYNYKYEEIKETLDYCYNKCVELGYYEIERESKGVFEI